MTSMVLIKCNEIRLDKLNCFKEKKLMKLDKMTFASHMMKKLEMVDMRIDEINFIGKMR